MCNIAGYIGDRPAAPILIEMMKREEGLDAGFFTGIATIHEGKIYSAKVLGDVRRLLELTDALRFPGTVGILHSRTPGRGGAERGHPFLSNDERIACVYNGGAGVYDLREDDPVLLRLIREGAFFPSAAENAKKADVRVGTEHGTAHTSDVRTQFARSLMRSDGLPLAAALEKTMVEYPSEIVALALDREDPGAISFVRGNAPMNLARVGGETYLATSALAFPEEVTEIMSLPPESSGRVTRDGLSIHDFSMPVPVERIDPKKRPAMEKALAEKLASAEEPLDFAHFEKALEPFFEEGKTYQSARIAYEALYQWVLAGRVSLTPYRKTATYGTEDDGIEVVHFALTRA